MAYCKKCGAYIPDGLSACLACGFDENSGAGKAPPRSCGEREQQNEDEVRGRSAPQPSSRRRKPQWAEQEQRRAARSKPPAGGGGTPAARPRSASAGAGTQEEEAEKGERAKTYANRPRQDGDQPASEQQQASFRRAELSEHSLFFCPVSSAPDDEFASYHAKQGLTLFVFSIIAMRSARFPARLAAVLFRFYCIYKGMTNALNGKEEPAALYRHHREKNN